MSSQERPQLHKPIVKDLLLILLVFAVLSLLLFFLYGSRRNTFLFIALALIVLPNIAAFVYGVPFVPTPMAAARRLVEAGRLKPGETVYDLGCGDGRLVYLAVKDYGVKATGLELSPIVYLLARFRHLLWRSGAVIKLGSFYRQDLSDADVIFCYISENILAKLRGKLETELKKGARVVSYVYPLAFWKEKERLNFEENGYKYTIWVYEKAEAGLSGPVRLPRGRAP